MVSTTTEPTLTSTTLVTSVRLVCVASTCCATTSGSPRSTSTRYETKNHPLYPGDHRSPTPERGWTWVTNILQLWSLVPVELREKHLNNASADTAPVIDLLSLGYAKLLGKGRLPEAPIVVRARYVSKEAEKKILEAGGVIELVA